MTSVKHLLVFTALAASTCQRACDCFAGAAVHWADSPAAVAKRHATRDAGHETGADFVEKKQLTPRGLALGLELASLEVVSTDQTFRECLEEVNVSGQSLYKLFLEQWQISPMAEVELWLPSDEGIIAKPYTSCPNNIDFAQQRASTILVVPPADVESKQNRSPKEMAVSPRPQRFQMVLTDAEKQQQHLLRSGSRVSGASRVSNTSGATATSNASEEEEHSGFFGSWKKSMSRMFSTARMHSFNEGDYCEVAFDLLELSLAVCDANAQLCRDFAMKVTEDRKTCKALKRLTMLARVVGLIPGGNGPGDLGLGPLSSELLMPPRDLAKAFVQDDMSALDWMNSEQGQVVTEVVENRPAATPAEPGFGAMPPRSSSLNHTSSLSSADGTLPVPRPAAQYQHSGSLGSADGTLGLPRKMSLGHSSSVSSLAEGSCADGTLAVPRPGGSINRGSSLGSADGTLGLPRLLGLSHSGSNLSRHIQHSTSNLGSDNCGEESTFASRFGLRRSSSNCSTGPDISYLGRRLGLLRGSSNSSSHPANSSSPRPLGLYRGTSNTSSVNDSETARRNGYNRSTSNFSSFSCTSLADFNQKHGISGVESPSFLQFLATVHEAGLKIPRGSNRPRRLCSIKEHSLDDAFNNRIEVEEADVSDDKMSYYSSQEMGKASVFELITSQGSVSLSTSCLKTQAAWQRSLIEQQRSLLVLVSRKLHQAEEKTKLDIAVSEDQRELLRNFRKIVTRKVENEESVDIQSKDLFVIIVESCPLVRAEICQLCQLLEYRCKAYASLTAAESEISNIMESTGSSNGSSPTFLVLLGTSWLDRDLPYHFKQEFVYVTLTSKAEEFELVGNELSASSESQIRSVLRERGIREYLLHPLSLEDMRRTVEAALQRRWAEEFLVCETLGRGSSGIVHRVKRLRDGHIFAMKEVPTRLLREKERQSLLQEVSLMEKFNWPTIISLECAWENPQQRLHYIVMPFSEGGSLKSRISQALHASVSDADGPSCSRSNSSLISSVRGQHLGAWYVQSLHGLSFLHYHGVLHRDIKPDNLMLGHGGLSLQICDLGSAMRLPGKGDQEAYVQAPVTTPLYSAPEVSKWKRCYMASDMWSLGATFFEVITLQSLAPGGSLQEPCSWLDALAESLEKGSCEATGDLQKQLEELAGEETALSLLAGISGDYDFHGHGEIQEVLQISHGKRPSAAAILASSSNMSVLRSAMAISRSTTGEVDQHMKDTKRLLQKSLHAQGLRSRSICKI
eukprot:s1100_g9.t1